MFSSVVSKRRTASIVGPSTGYIFGYVEFTSNSIKLGYTCYNLAENATTEIKKQSVDRKVSHRRILEDLNRIRGKAEEVWDKIGKSCVSSTSAKRSIKLGKMIKDMNNLFELLNLQISYGEQRFHQKRFESLLVKTIASYCVCNIVALLQHTFSEIVRTFSYIPTKKCLLFYLCNLLLLGLRSQPSFLAIAPGIS